MNTDSMQHASEPPPEAIPLLLRCATASSRHSRSWQVMAPPRTVVLLALLLHAFHHDFMTVAVKCKQQQSSLLGGMVDLQTGFRLNRGKEREGVKGEL